MTPEQHQRANAEQTPPKSWLIISERTSPPEGPTDYLQTILSSGYSSEQAAKRAIKRNIDFGFSGYKARPGYNKIIVVEEEAIPTREEDGTFIYYDPFIYYDREYFKKYPRAYRPVSES